MTSSAYLASRDTQIFDAIQQETKRQQEGLELIASENSVSQAVMEAQGSILTNKYAEGYPGKRYYGGCDFVDQVERIAIERVCELFSQGTQKCDAANVQPHSGSQANMAAYLALMQAGDRLLGMSLNQGGHLTHGSPVNFTGKLFQVASYGIHPETHRLDYDQVRDLAKQHKPRVIVAGASAYPREIDFSIFADISREVGADLVVDMAHIAGLVAVGLHPSPIGLATYTTSTTHKTLRGPRGGIILGGVEAIKKVNSLIFPGIQGGPLMHVIAAKAVAFGEALRPEFKTYQQNVLNNAKTLADALSASGFYLVTGGTDNHLMLIDLSKSPNPSVSGISGKEAEAWLDHAGLTVNKNTVPNETRSPFVTSGLRIGTPAVTTRGLGMPEMKLLSTWITDVLESKGSESVTSRVRKEVRTLCAQFPLPT